jgi:hypothetical protein
VTTRLLDRKKKIALSNPSLMSVLSLVKDISQLLTEGSKVIDSAKSASTSKLVAADLSRVNGKLQTSIDQLNRSIDRSGLLKSIKFAHAVELDLLGIANYMKTCKRIIIMSGAGISVSAGIPDFRSPNGLYLGGMNKTLPPLAASNG